MSRRSHRVLTALALVALPLALLEAVARVAPGAFGADPKRVADLELAVREGVLPGFEARPFVVYGRPRKARGGNAAGFFDRSWKVAKPPGVVRIACLGGSTTEGGNDAGPSGAYPTLLEDALDSLAARESLDVDFETLNFGVSGWTTAESLANWLLVAQEYEPDVVVVHHAVNDVPPRMWPDYRADYSHWRKPFEAPLPGPVARALYRASRAALLLRARGALPKLDDAVVRAEARQNPGPGGLEPLATSAFRDNVDAIVRHARANGIGVVLATLPTQPEALAEHSFPRWRRGVAEHNQQLRELAAEHGCGLADLERAAEARPAPLVGEWLDLVHLTVTGNAWKARRIGAAVAEQVPAVAAAGRELREAPR